ncbi:hypothetical protein [Streptomyces sp. NBC_00554]|uniref:hypothetical protein n=1 Tax=unclassified Streptomyces TaxID=2593676 RepID=UPI00352CF98F|nr:hypothetical protein OG256_27215 [Streptomyces sp. NBC_00564]WUC50164.1 hypothetical protein OG266_17805 [Streptomyces sp. NBC_00554]
MRLKLRQFRPRTGPHEHRVVQPWSPLRHTSLRDPDPYGMLTGDHDGLNRLAGLWRSALITAIGGLKADRGDSWRAPEVLICFKAYPPYAHFRRPGR